MVRCSDRRAPLGVLLALAVAALAAPTPARGQKLEIKESLEELQARAARDSNDAAAQFNLALGLLGKKKFAEAERALHAALAIEPQFAEAQLGLAVARERNEEYWKGVNRQKGDSASRAALEEVRRLYARAFLLDPFVNTRLMALTWRVWGNTRFTKGFEAFLEGRYEQAQKEFGQEIADVTRRQPRDSVPEGVLWMHALASARQSQWAEASADLEALMRVAAGPASDSIDTSAPLRANEYRYMLAALRQRAGDLDGAVPLYREVLEQDVSNFMAHVQLARIHEARRDYERAIEERRRAVDVNPDDASLLLDLGVTQGKAGAFQDAVTTLADAAARNPRDVRPWFWLGVAYGQLGRTADARAAFERFAATAPPRYAQMVAAARQQLGQGQ